jgi:hypothetical protein
MIISIIYLPYKKLTSKNLYEIHYLVSVLNEQHGDVIYADIKDYRDNENFIDDLQYADIYAIPIDLVDIENVNKFSKLIKEKYTNCKIIIGGTDKNLYNEFMNLVDYDYINSTLISSIESIIEILPVMFSDLRYEKKLKLYYMEKFDDDKY